MILKRAAATFLFFLAFSVSGLTQEGRQIRLDENTCKNVMPEYQRKKNNPLYAKALAAQKAGHANDMQKYRIRDVRFLYDTLKFAKCKGV